METTVLGPLSWSNTISVDGREFLIYASECDTLENNHCKHFTSASQLEEHQESGRKDQFCGQETESTINEELVDDGVTTVLADLDL